MSTFRSRQALLHTLSPYFGVVTIFYRKSRVILIALGSNLATSPWKAPVDICLAALDRLEALGVRICALSRFYETAPVPLSDQPWFVNAVASVDCDLPAAALLALLHHVEAEFGRVRRAVNEARLLDLDLIDHNGVLNEVTPVLPHPRLSGRAFVLYPLHDVAPGWRHPVDGRSVVDLIAMLPPDQAIRPMMPQPTRHGGAALP